MTLLETGNIKFRAGRYMVPGTLQDLGDGRLMVGFRFNKTLIEEIKAFEGARWVPDRKKWTVKDTQRNRFQLRYLLGQNPYERYDLPLVEFTTTRPLYDHQVEMTRHALTRHFCVLAAEMGTGKTLSVIEVIEASGFRDWWWVAPKSALRSVELEFEKWRAKVRPRFLTYEGLTKEIKHWPPGKKAPHGVVFDESSRIKTPTAQRTQAARELADGVRGDWGDDGFVILMSGTPAPKSPADWWSQCFAADTFVLTSQGPRRISELNGQRSFVFHGSLKHESPVGSFPSGRKQLFEIVTKEGYKLKVTDGQLMLADYSGVALWQLAKRLVPGDKLCLHNHKGAEWGGYGSYEDGYLMGHLFGDGHVDTSHGLTYGYLNFWPDDYAVIPYVLEILGEDHRCEPNGPEDRITICSKRVHALCRDFGLTTGKEITHLVEGASSDFLCGLLSGFFDTDGHVEQGRLRISLTQSDLPRIEAAQRILLYLGIPSRVYPKPRAVTHIADRAINSRASWVLTISGDHVRTFYDRIGFNHPVKNQTLREQLAVKSQMSQPFLAEIAAINPLGVEEVWDISVPSVKAFSANGFVAHNCETAEPGFIREGTIEKFKQRLGIVVMKESIQGGVYPQLITWKDSAEKCNTCGKPATDTVHDEIALVTQEHGEYHAFTPCINEIEHLYKRMQGLVLVKFKKDCLSLPEKRYEVIRVKPTLSVLRAASLIQAKCTTVIQTLTLLRELSDGFQYSEEKAGEETCPLCAGTGEIDAPKVDGTVEVTAENAEALAEKYPDHRIVIGDTFRPPDATATYTEELGTVRVHCPRCGGDGAITRYKRVAEQVACPKDDAVKELLDRHDDVGRVVFYGGFSGSIDRLVQICQQQGWETVTVDGRGWQASWGPEDELNMLRVFQDTASEDHPRVAFVGHPAAAGMGLTLTASPMVCFFSNDFNGESRWQAEDRVHRAGMDANRGCTVYDIVHLPTDEKILANLTQKRDLMNLSMGDIASIVRSAMADGERVL